VESTLQVGRRENREERRVKREKRREKREQRREKSEEEKTSIFSLLSSPGSLGI